MKMSNIGGQAVLEGIMMRNGGKYAIAVRKPDQNIEVKTGDYTSVFGEKDMRNIPIVRGVVSFIDSLVTGIKCLMYSASFFEDEEEIAEEKEKLAGMSEEEQQAYKQKKEKDESRMMTGTLILSLVIAIAVFMIVPYFLTHLLEGRIASSWALSAIESLIRVGLFLGYLIFVSQMKDIQRTFMYHGAEHKCINCVEHGMELNVENVMKSSRLHKRCGTSFLFFVLIVSIVFLMLIHTDSHLLRIVIRIALIPVIAGVSFEIIRLAGRTDNPVINLLSQPGLALQRLTTREPDESQAEVAIKAVEAVFDWRAFLETYHE